MSVSWETLHVAVLDAFAGGAGVTWRTFAELVQAGIRNLVCLSRRRKAQRPCTAVHSRLEK